MCVACHTCVTLTTGPRHAQTGSSDGGGGGAAAAATAALSSELAFVTDAVRQLDAKLEALSEKVCLCVCGGGGGVCVGSDSHSLL